MTSLIARIRERLDWLFQKPKPVPYVPPAPMSGESMSAEELDASVEKFNHRWDWIVPVYPPTKEPKMGTFQVFKDKTGAWRWRLRAANSRILCQSEAYTRKYDAKRSLEAIDRALTPGHRVEWPE